jgi:hypothetical protein
MKPLKENWIEFVSVLVFAVGMTLVLNLIEDCDLQSITLALLTALLFMWLFRWRK